MCINTIKRKSVSRTQTQHYTATHTLPAPTYRTLIPRAARAGMHTPPAGGLLAVEVAVDLAGDGLDLGGELLLDLVEGEAVLVGDQVDRQTQVAEAARATDAVQVGLRRRKVRGGRIVSLQVECITEANVCCAGNLELRQ